MKWLNKDRIAWILLLTFIGMQLIRIDKTPPASDPQKDYLSMTNAPDDVAVLIKNACYDCHAHTTKYPWYSNIAPVSWWLQGHVDNGRKHLNFSLWGDYSEKKRSHKIEECVDSQEGLWMPLKSYTWGHPEAKLTDGERQKLIEWWKGQL